MTRVAVKIAYLGNGFCGSQRQPGLRTVEGTVISDLKKILDCSEETLSISFASRTDRGVNALGNVAVFDTDRSDSKDLLRGLNAVSKGVFYRSYCIVDEKFNPRFADRRHYRYALPSDNIDIEKARECAKIFLGTHDFKRFCRPDGKTSTMTMEDIVLTEIPGMIFIDFTARYYLWNVIRRITAAIAAVGTGERSISDVKDALEGKDITFGLARPDGLTLTDIVYDNIKFETLDKNLYGTKVRDEKIELALKDLFYSELV